MSGGTRRWYFQHADGEKGPFTAEEVQEAVKSGEITRETIIRADKAGPLREVSARSADKVALTYEAMNAKADGLSIGAYRLRNGAMTAVTTIIILFAAQAIRGCN